MELPVGIDNFQELITYRTPEGEPYLFVDKSLLIKDILGKAAKVVLFTRPRRFGKTLNMSMLHHFFAKQVDGQLTEDLFKHLKIAEHEKYMAYQGKYPVIYLTFKEIKHGNFEVAYRQLCEIMSSVYKQHRELLSSPQLSDREKEVFNLIIDKKAEEVDVHNSLKHLTYYLHLHYRVKPIILIDEYDTPIHTAYIEGYYDDIIQFMRVFLGAALKGNPYLEKAVLTGILRVSKESLFSGLNNLEIYSLLSSDYGEYFGFTETEVEELLRKADLSEKQEEVRRWYNGYQCGKVVIYNPWSILSFVKHKEFASYWINTSDNSLVKELLVGSTSDFKRKFQLLLEDKPIEIPINENFVFNNLKKDGTNIWALLLMTGYLKATVIKGNGSHPLCCLKIPNEEVKDSYQNLIKEWLSGSDDTSIFNTFLSDFLSGNVDSFEDQLRDIMMQTVSVHDVPKKQTEGFYHAFMLGLTANIRDNYKVDSNKESGLGRYDIMIIPFDPKKLGIILEIKCLPKDKPDTPENLSKTADLALQQIQEKHYNARLLQEGVKRCLNLGIAFSGKEFFLAHQFEDLN